MILGENAFKSTREALNNAGLFVSGKLMAGEGT
jgi:hypothetical protein